MSAILPPAGPLADLMKVHLDATQRDTASRIRIPALPPSGQGSNTPTVRPGKEAA